MEGLSLSNGSGKQRSKRTITSSEKISKSIVNKSRQVWHSTLYYSWKNKYTYHSVVFTWWKRSMSIFASACQELSSTNKTYNAPYLFNHLAEIYMQKPNNHSVIQHRRHQDAHSTCDVLLKNNFGSFEEVLSDDKNFLSSSHWAAVKTLLQDLWHSCWLGWKLTEEPMNQNSHNNWVSVYQRLLQNRHFNHLKRPKHLWLSS